MGNALLNGQEVSVQHAVYVCIGLPFRGSSREVVFVPSSPPAQRTFLVKQDWELKNLLPDSTDCIALSIVDKYAFRKSNPHLQALGADSVCLADFAALFSPVQRNRFNDEDANNDAERGSETEGHELEEDEPIPLGHTFAEKRYSKRSQERIIRYVHYKLHEDPEAYFREQLLLFYPWSAELGDPFGLSANEDAYLLSGHSTFQSRYEAVRSVIEQNRKRYEFNDRLDWDEVQQTAKELVKADERMLQLGACKIIKKHASEDCEEEHYDFGQDLGVSAVTRGSIPIVRMTDNEFREEARRLIWDQLRYWYHILHLYKYGGGRPFYSF